MDDWLKKAGDALGDLAGSAARQAEIVQLQAKLGSLDDDLDRVYLEAGKRAEELLKARQIYDDELRVILERARTIREQMMEIRQQVSELQRGGRPQGAKARTCPNCDTPVPEGEDFCPHCGARVP